MNTPLRIPRNVLITGDPICDCHFYAGERATADSPKARGFRISTNRRGGALLLHDLIKEVVSDRPGIDVTFGLEVEPENLPSHYHAYCLWEPRISNPGETDKSKQLLIWRAVEPLLGYGHQDGRSALLGNRRSDLPWPDVVVIDDAGLDFRKDASKERWPMLKGEADDSCPRWVVLKLSGAIGDSALWTAITQHCRDNLIVIVSAEQVRQSDIRLSKGLSWEATVEDLRAELATNPGLQPLLKARHLIVTFRSDGAFWLDNSSISSSNGSSKAMLVFDGTRAEGDWAYSQGEGTVFGYLSCFTAAIVRELFRNMEHCVDTKPVEPDFASALSAGLSATRELQRCGHGPVYIEVASTKGTVEKIVNPEPGFPLKDIAGCIRQPKDKFVSTLLPKAMSNSSRGQWMMLDEWQVKARDEKNIRPYLHAAFAGAILGPGALERFPAARFGDLLTVDRQEIESLRILRRLIADYESRAARDSKPLNIGVFGPPGAGKSFGVKEIAKAVLGRDVPFLPFNLSQFNQPDDLIGALHQVRDKVLAGNTPVVFWDEFDSENYRWLQYLLAPMNDGVFVEGPMTHPIGKCIFVLAGGTSPNFESFGPINPDDEQNPLHRKIAALRPDIGRHVGDQWKDFVLKKGPDFKSRLVSYLNVLGPNPRRCCTQLGGDGQRHWEDDPHDLCWPIRRAFFIRQKFKLKDDERLEIDHGVLRALLEIPRFKSGARSLEFLCTYLRDQTKGGSPRRSSLPGQHLLDMHVDAARFWKICERDLEFLPAARAIAQSFHDDWRKNPASKDNDLNVPWESLDESTRSSNVQQALRIATNLSIVDLKIEKGAPLSSKQEKAIQAHILRHLELLAEAEHNGWMVERMIAGWRYASIPKKDPLNKLHPLLLPYAQLSELEKEKDRRPILGFMPNATQKKAGEEPVDGYIERLKRVGFRIQLSDASLAKRKPNSYSQNVPYATA